MQVEMSKNGRIIYGWNLYKAVYAELKYTKTQSKAMSDGRVLLAKELEAFLHIPQEESIAA